MLLVYKKSIFRYRSYLTLGHLSLVGKASVISNSANNNNSNKSGISRKYNLRVWQVLVVLEAKQVVAGHLTKDILPPLNKFTE